MLKRGLARYYILGRIHCQTGYAYEILRQLIQLGVAWRSIYCLHSSPRLVISPEYYLPSLCLLTIWSSEEPFQVTVCWSWNRCREYWTPSLCLADLLQVPGGVRWVFIRVDAWDACLEIIYRRQQCVWRIFYFDPHVQWERVQSGNIYSNRQQP